jgi:phosphoribosylformimino-5-aminoimidazole carboxamide ribotide isomerase
MDIIPAIDLKGGRCVRLYQGDFDKVTVFSDDPAEIARRWEGEGARRIHVVDLDGAKGGRRINLEALTNILSAVHVPVQSSGGIRTYEDAQQALDMGVDRVVLGTVAVEESDLVAKLCQDFGREKLIVSADARDGKVTTWGWVESTQLEATVFLNEMASLGVERFVYTDIARDGTLTEPNFAAVQRLVEETGKKIIAAGGISSVEHLVRLAEAGVEGAIIGRAIYTGDLDLKQALERLG